MIRITGMYASMAKLKESQITDNECGALLKEWNEKRVRIDWLRLSDYLDNNSD